MSRQAGGQATEEGPEHAHRTARVIEVIGASRESFDDAIRNALDDATETLRGITGAHVLNMSVKCDNGAIREYRVDLKVAFGVERTGGLGPGGSRGPSGRGGGRRRS